jgi:hypothetical protein
MTRALAIILALFASPALATDYELHATSQALMMAGLYSIGMAVGPNALSAIPRSTTVTKAGDIFAVSCYGTKKIGGVAQSGYYCILRWEGPDPLPTIPNVTAIPIPANSNLFFF